MAAEPVPPTTQPSEPLPPATAAHHASAPTDHRVHFYENDEGLADATAGFLVEGLSTGQWIVAIATAPHHDALADRLASRGFDVERLRQSGRYTTLDAEQTLATFMVGDRPDQTRFHTHVGGLIQATLLRAGAAGVRAYGEMVDVLWNAGNPSGALRLEELWDDLMATHPFSLLCAYALGNFYTEAQHASLDAIHRPQAAAEGVPSVRSLEAEIAHRKQAEAALRESEERYRRIISLLPAAVYTCDAPSGVITFYNDRAAELWGRTPVLGERDERFCGSFKLWWPDGRPLAHADTPMASAVREGRAFRNVEVIIERPDSRRVTVLVNIDPIRDDHGAVVGAINVFHDTTALRHAEHTIRESEERTRLLLSVVTDVPWTTDAEGRFTTPQPAWAAFTGQRWEQLRDFGWLEAIHPDDRLRVMTLWQTAARERSLYKSDGRLWHAPARDWRYFEARATPRMDAAGNVIEWVGTCTDVTERRLGDEERQRRLALAQEHARTTDKLNRIGAIVASGLDTTVVLQTVTDAATDLTAAEFGAFFYNTRDESGDSLMLYTLSGASRDVFAKFPEPRATALFGPTFRGEGSVRLDDVRTDPRYGRNAPYHGTPSGHVPVRSYLAIPVKARSGEVLGGLFFGHSQPGVFTAQHQQLAEGIASWASIALENARLYADLEGAVRARDEFISIASHELRNPINAMQLQLVGLHRAALARGETLPQGWVCDRLGRAVDDVGRLARLIDNLLDVSRITAGRLDLEPEEVDLAALVRSAAARFEPQSRQGQIRVDAPTPAAGWWDRLWLEQIVTNLLSNAVKYGEGQPVEVSVDADEDQVRLTVRDHGIGIGAEQQVHLFERFQRNVSGRDYGGFGLGLWITRKVVDAMDGSIAVDSRPGEGAAFSVRLPRRPVARGEPDSAGPREERP